MNVDLKCWHAEINQLINQCINMYNNKSCKNVTIKKHDKMYCHYRQYELSKMVLSSTKKGFFSL